MKTSYFDKSENVSKFNDDIFNILSQVLNVDKNQFHLEKELSEFNFTSLIITEIAESINTKYNIKISPTNFFGCKTIGSFSDYLLKLYESEIFAQYSKNHIEKNLLELLSERARMTPEKLAYSLLDSGGELVSQITYSQLYKRAQSIAIRLQANDKVEKVALVFPQGLDFAIAFFGSLLMGAIAIPVPLPVKQQYSDHKENACNSIIQEINPDIILTTISASGLKQYLGSIPGNFAEKIITIEEIVDDNKNRNISPPTITSDTTAYIEYTSGTTGKTKGVTITHGNIICSNESIKNAFKLSVESRSLNWLPHYHYLGLSIGIIQPVFTGFTGYLLSEMDFIKNPSSWLIAITKHKITLSGAPNFSYEMCLKGINADDKKELDLSSWEIAFNCGERIQKDTLEEFYKEFEFYGLNKSALCPCYGLTESTSIIAVNDEYTTENLYINIDSKQVNNLKAVLSNKKSNSKMAVVNCGRPNENTSIIIVNPQSQTKCNEEEIGEIWIKSNNNSMGYYNQPDEIQEALYANLRNRKEGHFFKTGDCGFLSKGSLYLLGKINHVVNDTVAVQSDIQSKLTGCIGRDDEIAVIGMSGIFPQSDNYPDFWKNIISGKDLISTIPSDRWNWRDIYGEPDNESFKTNVIWGGFFNDIRLFDSNFFNISPIEAMYMDPVQRKLVQIVWNAFEDAGYRMSDISGKKVGVFIGNGLFDYMELIASNEKCVHAYLGTGLLHCMAANRISYLFDFKGPSESVDTACSSSLVALNRAVKAMSKNECEMAVVGGANAILSAGNYVVLSNAGMLSPDGKCKTFDKSANGYVRGEGVGVVLLKSFKKALKDKDHIYGIIKGSSVNHGGHTASITAPNPFSQSDVICDAIEQAGIPVDTINYVETHGTGTKLGDPIEINGLKMAFENSSKDNKYISNKKNFCGLGSVKANIGHLEAAAGIAGLIKVLLSMKYKKIPPQLHLNSINPEINLDNSPFYIIGSDAQDWNQLIDSEGNPIPRRAGISSFGFGGVNSHVIVESYEDKSTSEKSKEEFPGLFVLSAKTEAVLTEYVHLFVEFLDENETDLDFRNLIFTLQNGRESMDVRLAVIAQNVRELVSELIAFLEDETIAAENESRSIFHSRIYNEISEKKLILNEDNPLDLIHRYIAQNDLSNLAKLWVSGTNINWHELYRADEEVKRIPLPTYPFQKVEHWIKSLSKNKQRSQEIFDYQWVESFIESDGLTEDVDAQFILLCDKEGICNKFSKILEKNHRTFYKIKYAAKYRKIKPNSYQINPYEKSSYDKVFDNIGKLKKGNKTFILNFWPLDYKESSSYKGLNLKGAVDFTCTTALNIMQSVISCQTLSKPQVWFICSNVQPVENERLNLKSATLWGACKSIVVEHPDVFRSIIDIGSFDTFKPETLFNEVANWTPEGEIVYRNQKRYVPRMVPAKITPVSNLNVRNDGTYLITGGLGTLGLLAGKWLSENNAKKVLLLSRNGLDNKKTDRLSRWKLDMIDLIKSNGTEIEIYSVDVSKKTQLKKVCQKYMETKELRGIFHAAGVAQNNLFMDMTYEDFYRVVEAKMLGTWNLHEITAGYELDCFVLYSSGASIWGVAHAAHYCAGNYFLDMYAQFCKMEGLPVTNINWGGIWKDSGIVVDEHEEYMKTIGIHEIYPDEGMQLLSSILQSGDTQKIVAPIHWDTFLQVMNARRKNMIFEYIDSGSNSDLEASDMSESFIQTIAHLPREQQMKITIETLSDILKEILGISKDTELEIYQGFFEMGLDSLTSIQLVKKLQKKLGVEISTTDIFDSNTLNLLTEYIIENFTLNEDIDCEKEDHDSIDCVSRTLETLRNIDEDLENRSKEELLEILEFEMAQI